MLGIQGWGPEPRGLGVVHGHERNKPGLCACGQLWSYHMVKPPSSEWVGPPAGGRSALKACLWFKCPCQEPRSTLTAGSLRGPEPNSLLKYGCPSCLQALWPPPCSALRVSGFQKGSLGQSRDNSSPALTCCCGASIALCYPGHIN